MSNSVDPIVLTSRELNKNFMKLVEPHRNSLWKYCQYLTGSPWDGEDLFQETLMKAFATLAQLWHPLLPKSYLFRIATNTWIDQLRRSKVTLDAYDEEEIVPANPITPMEIREAIEVLVGSLAPRQAAVVLLMDVFEFTAPEVANMVRVTEGAVYAALHRARTKLRSSAVAERKTEQSNRSTVSQQEQRIIEIMLQAINSGDSQTILELMSDTIHNDVTPGFQEYSKKDILSGSFGYVEPDRNVSYSMLWGKPVFVVMAETENGLALHDIHYPEVSNGKIVCHKSYYFCREMLLAAGKELNVPVQLIKHPGIQWEEDSL